jgi:hypothetical protein
VARALDFEGLGGSTRFVNRGELLVYSLPSWKIYNCRRIFGRIAILNTTVARHDSVPITPLPGLNIPLWSAQPRVGIGLP